MFIFFILFLCSCKTYQRYTVLKEWQNKWNDKIQIVETRTYNRKDKTLLNTSIDTVFIENKQLDGSFIYNY